MSSAPAPTSGGSNGSSQAAHIAESAKQHEEAKDTTKTSASSAPTNDSKTQVADDDDDDADADVDPSTIMKSLDLEAEEFARDAEISRIMNTFRLDSYSILGLRPGIPPSTIKAVYRRKSLLIHPDKTRNPLAPEAFDRLAKAQAELMDDKRREQLDESIADARMLLIRERKLTIDSEEVKDPDEEFLAAWREKTKQVLVDDELRRRRQKRAQMQEEGRKQQKEEEEAAERKRKREQDVVWEDTRDKRIESWRDFQKAKAKKEEDRKRKKKLKPLG